MRTSGTKGTPTTEGLPETAETQAVTHATTVSLATSYSKDESNRATFRNSRNASKGKNEGKLVKPATSCRKANYGKDNMNIMDVNSVGPPESVGSQQQ